MKNKLIYTFVTVVIGMSVCGSVWLLLRNHSASKQESRRITDTDTANALSPYRSPDGNQVFSALTPAERKIQGLKNYFMSRYSDEQLATPQIQKWLEVLDSPEALEYMDNDTNYRKLSNFLESQGITVNWGQTFDKMFREHFPTGTPEDYESEIRLKVAKQFTDATPVYLADSKTAALQRINVLAELIEKDKATTAWFMKRFGQDWDAALQIEQTNGEHNEALVWLTDVQTNAASLVASAETARGDTPDTQASAPSWDLSSVMESPSASDSETEMPTTVDTEQRATMTDTEIERSLTPQPPSTPTAQKTDTPGDIQTNLENVLKSQFSKERFDGAMDTLETHGNEEGLRRLRAHDPEVAKQIEQHRKGKEVSR